jgi:hypothetical protein
MARRIEFFLMLTLIPGAFADGIYNNIPAALPPNVPSLGYEATSTAEFGGLIQFVGGSSYSLTSATVVMSDWTYLSQWSQAVDGTTITTAGFYVPLALGLYNVTGADNAVGALIASALVDAFIPWRPEPSEGCGTAWLAANNQCYNGSASTVTFDLTGITVPGEIIYGLAFNTTDHGLNPTGVAGPYDSLNFGLSSTPPSSGINPLPDTAYWNTTNASMYADGGAAGVGAFRQDTNWAPYSGAVEFTATPEPATFLLLGAAFVGIGLKRRSSLPIQRRCLRRAR